MKLLSNDVRSIVTELSVIREIIKTEIPDLNVILFWSGRSIAMIHYPDRIDLRQERKYRLELHIQKVFSAELFYSIEKIVLDYLKYNSTIFCSREFIIYTFSTEYGDVVELIITFLDLNHNILSFKSNDFELKISDLFLENSPRIDVLSKDVEVFLKHGEYSRAVLDKEGIKDMRLNVSIPLFNKIIELDYPDKNEQWFVDAISLFKSLITTKNDLFEIFLFLQKRENLLTVLRLELLPPSYMQELFSALKKNSSLEASTWDVNDIYGSFISLLSLYTNKRAKYLDSNILSDMREFCSRFE